MCRAILVLGLIFSTTNLAYSQIWKPVDDATSAVSKTPNQTTRPKQFRYIDPVTGKEVIRPGPPVGYAVNRTQIDSDGTWALEIIGKFPTNSPSPTVPTAEPKSTVVELPDGKGEELATVCFEALRKSFYDPYSARMDEYKILRMPDGGIAAVVMLNGKNRFGAYVGAKPFYCWKTAAGPFKVGEGEPEP